MEELAGVILLLLLSGLLLALFTGGWNGHGGAKDWFKAKFLGQASGSV